MTLSLKDAFEKINLVALLFLLLSYCHVAFTRCVQQIFAEIFNQAASTRCSDDRKEKLSEGWFALSIFIVQVFH